MKFAILAVGRTATPWLDEGIRHYLTRASRYAPVELTVLPDVNGRLAPARQKELEGAAILAALQPGDCLTLLDERGTEHTSRSLAQLMQKRMAQGLKRWVLAIGGPYGFSQAVYDRADGGMLALSRLTFTHEMARLFVAEQLYRGLSILNGDPYHHD